MKKLPIKIDAIVKSSCSMYYKMAIIQTIPNCQAWLAVNMKGFVEAHGHSKYGNIFEEYFLSDFSSVFEIYEKMQSEITGDNIIDYLISKIDEGYYIILYTNYNALYGNNNSEPWFHETLIYGYDKEEQVLYSPLLKRGRFCESKISFEQMRIAYLQAKDYYKENLEFAFSRGRWFHVITELKPHEISIPANIYFEYAWHIEKELEGGLLDRYKSQENGEYEHTYGCFYGIIAQSEIAKLLRRYAEHEKDPHSIRFTLITNAVRYLSERLQILFQGIMWFVEDRGLSSNSEIQEIIEGYNKLIVIAKRNALLMEKFAITKDMTILYRVADTIDLHFPREKDLLENYYKYVRRECISRYEIFD